MPAATLTNLRLNLSLDRACDRYARVESSPPHDQGPARAKPESRRVASCPTYALACRWWWAGAAGACAWTQ